MDFIDQEARTKYKLRRKQDLDRCREFLSQGDFPGLETIGHNLKGNGISFGYPELSQLGERLEYSAKEANFEEAQKLIESFEHWIEEHPPVSGYHI